MTWGVPDGDKLASKCHDLRINKRDSVTGYWKRDSNIDANGVLILHPH